MRLLRIALRHYRGIDDRSVELDRSGVTIVAGPNEVGKTSLAEALDLLFEHLDSSKRKDVLAVKPVHRDAGAEIEVDVEAGAYRFTYFKRFHKKPETRLTVTAPAAESHTGREAHERVQAILGETVDMPLWRALRIDQGAALGLPEIGDVASLSKALDAAAGSARADDEALTLFDRAKEEYERWYTGTGREKKELTELTSGVTSTEATRETCAEALRKLERDVERSRALAAAVEENRRQLVDDEARAAETTEALRALERRQTEVERVEAERETARARLAAAARDRADRDALIERDATAQKHLADTREAASRGGAGEDAEAKLAKTAAALEAALATDAAAAAAQTLREEDLDFRRAELDHAQLSERLQRIVVAEEAAQAAEETLAAARVDAQALAAIREAQRSADAARIRAEAGSPEVVIDAERAVSLRRGEEDETVPAGESVTRSALDELVVEAADVVRVTIRPAGDAAELREAMRAAAERLSALLARSGVDDVAGAEAADNERQEAERAVARREEIVRADLRDLSREDIERKVRNLRPRVDGYVAERRAVAGAEEVPATFDAAQDALDDARGTRRRAAKALDEARHAHDTARAEMEQRRVAAESARTRVEIAERDAKRAGDALDAARATEADDEVAARCEKLAAAAASTEDAARKAREALDAAQPDAVRRAAESADAAVVATRKALRDAQDESLAVRTRLQQAGQEGLAERLDNLDTALHHQRRTLAATQRRAAAARLLFETLSARRDAAKRAYVAPLRDRVVRLGKLVFGATFEVDLDEDLSITQRTVDGRTVPFDGLSGGAQEQLDIILRAAAAMVVSDSGGVPLILDDALGYSDPSRLAALGAVLSLAGEHCQVIVLTCMPERYRHVAGANTIRLG